jgi:hypothetical protein
MNYLSYMALAVLELRASRLKISDVLDTPRKWTSIGQSPWVHTGRQLLRWSWLRRYFETSVAEFREGRE